MVPNLLHKSFYFEKLQEERAEISNEIRILDDRHTRNHEELDNRRDSDAQFHKTAILKMGKFYVCIILQLVSL